MPALGSIFDLGGHWNSDSGFFGFVSYAVPPTVYEVSLNGQTEEWAHVESAIDPRRYQVEQLWFNSKDGTRVPMFVVSKKGMVRNGQQSNAAFRLWRVQSGTHAVFQSQRDVAAAGAGRRLC